MTTTILATAMAIPQVALSESGQSSGGSPTVAVNLDFQVIIPTFLNFRVGPTGATIDLLTLTVPAAQVGDTIDIPFTGGDAGGGAVNVIVRSNAGQVTITETNNSGNNGLANVAGDFIPYTEILTTSSSGALAAPTLSNSGGGFSTPTLTGGNVTNQVAVWSYDYSNEAIYEPGDYGTSARGGRVTYTAVTP